MEVSPKIYRKIPVCLKEHEYALLLGRDLISEIKSTVDQLMLEGYQIAFFVDAAIADHYSELLQRVLGAFPLCILPGGEATKSFEQYQYCCEFLANHRIGRKSALFCIGGGVLGDLVGFVAATYCRGVDYYLIPTTLLAMVDSSIGGKTSIDLPQGKNLVGAFHHPRAVFMDVQFLKTLPQREFNAGMAEVIKYGLLADPKLFEQLLKHPAITTAGDGFLYDIIERSCLIKARIVGVDEKESDQVQQRFQLNLGHTFAHAIEKVMHYDCLHGEAVGLGLLLAARYSKGLGWLDSDVVDALYRVLQLYSLPVQLSHPLLLSELMHAMRLDKKTRNGRIQLVLLEKIGQVRLQSTVDEELLRKIWIEVGATL